MLLCNANIAGTVKQKQSKVYGCSSSHCNIATSLLELTCHMESHSVTCHPPLPQLKVVLDLATPGMQGWVDLGTAVKMCSPCPRLRITVALAINTAIRGELRIVGPLILQSGALTTRPLRYCSSTNACMLTTHGDCVLQCLNDDVFIQTQETTIVLLLLHVALPQVQQTSESILPSHRCLWSQATQSEQNTNSKSTPISQIAVVDDLAILAIVALQHATCETECNYYWHVKSKVRFLSTD